MPDSNVTWDKGTEDNFKKLINKVPVFLRNMARDKVLKKVEALVKNDNRTEIGEKDMVDAFFEVTPFGFHGPLKCDMEEFHIDYTQYGHPQ